MNFHRLSSLQQLRQIGPAASLCCRQWRAAAQASTGAPRALRSRSHNVFVNLAWEQRLYETMNSPAMLLWANEPTVVLGVNQNPFVECDLQRMKERQITLARRFSGGGAVFHDLGNLNFTFLTTRSAHDPTSNSQMLARCINIALSHETNVQTKRNDILVNGHKVSGSAYRLGSKMAYHHCTLLLNSDLELLRGCLHSPLASHIKTKGVESIRAPVQCLHPDSDEQESLLDHVVRAYAEQQKYADRLEIEDVDPLIMFSGDSAFTAHLESLQSPSFKYGRTPEFTLRYPVELSSSTVTVELTAKRGLLLNVSVETASGTETLATEQEGLPFEQDIVLTAVSESLRSSSTFTQADTGTLVDKLGQLQIWIRH